MTAATKERLALHANISGLVQHARADGMSWDDVIAVLFCSVIAAEETRSGTRLVPENGTGRVSLTVDLVLA